MEKFYHLLDTVDADTYEVKVLPRVLSALLSLFSPFMTYDFGYMGKVILAGNPKSVVTRAIVRIGLKGRVPSYYTLEDCFCFMFLHEIGHYEAEGGHLGMIQCTYKDMRKRQKDIAKATKGMSRVDKNRYFGNLPGEREADEYALAKMMMLLE